jgi:hypothetical protein
MHKSLAFGILATAATSLTIGSVAPAKAFMVDFSSLGVTGAQSSLTFPSTPSGLSLMAAPDMSTQGYVQATGSGLCIFANSTDGVNRCGVLNQSPVVTNYDNIGIAPNVSTIYTGFSISQVLNNGSINNSGAGQIFVRRGSPTGTLLETINISSLTIGGLTAFSSPLSFAAGEKIFFQASGSNASIRLGKLEAVPGPLPLLGAGAALGWSRRLRFRTRSAMVSSAS